MTGRIGTLGRLGIGRLGAAGPSVTPDFVLTNSEVTTAWGVVTVGDLVPINAPAGVTFRLVFEDAGLAVVNG